VGIAAALRCTPVVAPTVTQTFWRSRAARLTGTFVGLAGLCATLTVLFWSMRAVMEIGGSCASGNTPYEIARPCPQGIPGLMLGSIFGGILMLGVYLVSAAGGPSLWPLAWPALFLSLGWNFFEYGVDPPLGGDTAPGWLICGVLFAVMGGVPLLLLIRAGFFAGLITGSAVETDSVGSPTVSRGALLALQVLAIVVGVWAGWRIFDWGNG